MNPTTETFWNELPLGEGVTLLMRDANGLVAFNKPAGILSHPNSRADEGRSLLTTRYSEEGQHFHWKTEAGEERRLWLLNRLDGATSGVILAASSEALALAVREQFAKKKIRKVYNALVFGKPSIKFQLWRDLLAVQRKGGQVRSNARAGNIPATTQFQFLQHVQGAFSTSLIRLEPQTGRSHQLRVQCATRHLPIVGDQTYGDFGHNRNFTKSTGLDRLFLHSLETNFNYEFAGKSFPFKAAAPLPPEFRKKY